jgi:hypothetical protein
VETGDSFAPAETTCAACRGEAPVVAPAPELPTLGVPPIPASVPPSPQAPKAAPFAAPFATPLAPPERKSRRRLWALLSSVIAGVLSGAGAFLQAMAQSKDRGIGYDLGTGIGTVVFVLGFSLVVAALCAGILAIFKQPFRRALGFAYCIIVLVLGGLYFLGSSMASLGQRMAQQKKTEAENVKQTLDGMESDAHAMLESMNDGGEGEPLRLGGGPIPDDDLGKVRHMTQILFSDMAATQREYNEALEKEGLGTLLDPDRLATDEAMEESRVILARSRKVVEVYREKMRVLSNSAPERLKKYRMDPDTRREVLEGMKNAKAGATDYHGLTWDLEEKIVNCMGEVIDHLERSRADWVVSESLITFSKDEDLETFQAIIAEIDECSAEQTKIRESAVQDMKAEVESAKSDLPK